MELVLISCPADDDILLIWNFPCGVILYDETLVSLKNSLTAVFTEEYIDGMAKADCYYPIFWNIEFTKLCFDNSAVIMMMMMMINTTTSTAP